MSSRLCGLVFSYIQPLRLRRSALARRIALLRDLDGSSKRAFISFVRNGFFFCLAISFRLPFMVVSRDYQKLPGFDGSR